MEKSSSSLEITFFKNAKIDINTGAYHNYIDHVLGHLLLAWLLASSVSRDQKKPETRESRPIPRLDPETRDRD